MLELSDPDRIVCFVLLALVTFPVVLRLLDVVVDIMLVAPWVFQLGVVQELLGLTEVFMLEGADRLRSIITRNLVPPFCYIFCCKIK